MTNGPIGGEGAPVGLRKYLAAARSEKIGRDTSHCWFKVELIGTLCHHHGFIGQE